MSAMGAWAERLRQAVDGALDSALPREDEPPELLHRAMRYAVFPGGKRVRPLLALSAALVVARRRRDAGTLEVEVALERAMPCAVACELVHSYSLVHDDLPAMDDDDFRRGRPTVHRAFGEDIAILAGDALLPLAFEVLTSERARGLMGAEAALACARELAHASGSRGMAGGQAVDLGHARPCAGGLEGAETLADLKTGALITASVRCGAIACGTSRAELEELTRFGELFGRAFQVFDDLADVRQDRAAAAQRPRGPAVARPTFPDVLGPERAKEYGQELVRKAVESLSRFSEDARELAELARALAGPCARCLGNARVL